MGGAPGLTMAALPKRMGSHVLGDLGVCRHTSNFILHAGTVLRHSAVQIVFADLFASANGYRLNLDMKSCAALLSVC